MFNIINRITMSKKKHKFGAASLNMSRIDEQFINVYEGQRYLRVVINVFDEPTIHGKDFVISQDTEEKITLGWGRFFQKKEEQDI